MGDDQRWALAEPLFEPESDLQQWWPEALGDEEHLLIHWAAHRPTDPFRGETLCSPLLLASYGPTGLEPLAAPVCAGPDNRRTPFRLSAALQQQQAWLAWACDYETALPQICLSTIDLSSVPFALPEPTRLGDGAFALKHPRLAAGSFGVGLAFVGSTAGTDQLFFRLLP